MPHAAPDSAMLPDALRRVGIDALFGPVGRHPWVNDAGKVDAAKAGTWMANIILMAGGSPKTAFACALEVVTDITDNPSKFKDFASRPNVKDEGRRTLGLENTIDPL